MRFLFLAGAAAASFGSIASAQVVANDFGNFEGADGWLADHNHCRCRHGAPLLKYDADLARKAQIVADGLAKAASGLSHSDSYNTVPYSGENLAMGSGTFTCNGTKQTYGQHCAVWAWYNEYNKYLTAEQANTTGWLSASGIGHFTAMMWKGTNILGCGSSGSYFVCHYSHDRCKADTSSKCWGTSPPGLPNFNMGQCKAKVCLEASNYEEQCSGTGGSNSTTTTTAAPTSPVVTTVAPATNGPLTTTKASTTSRTRRPSTTRVASTISPVQTTTPMPAGSGGFGKLSGILGWLADHNYFRCLHGAALLTWDADLARKAQAVVDALFKANSRLKHSDSYNVAPYAGENLASGSGNMNCNGVSGPYSQHCAVWFWYKEYQDLLGCSKVQSSAWTSVSGAGHFTAMAWKGIDALGCASKGKYFVCHYSSKRCKNDKSSKCWGTSPPGLPNFNKSKCKVGECLECAKPERAAQCSMSGATSRRLTADDSADFELSEVYTGEYVPEPTVAPLV